MNKSVLNTGIQDYIRNYSNSDIVSVLLKPPLFEKVENKELVQQIEGRLKCREKLPSWYKTPQIYYPEKRAIEQSSSEATAFYKTGLVEGNTLIDITGGFGVDSYYFSKKVSAVTYCERQAELAEISRHNFSVLGAKNIDAIHGDGLEVLKNQNKEFDWVYLDPSRRVQSKGRVFLLEETEPPLPQSLETIWPACRHILVKTSPLLDLTSGIRSLENVREIHIVAVKNDVKELLWVMSKEFSGEAEIRTINIRPDSEQKFNFSASEEKLAASNFGPPAKYIYEPNAALMKSGAFKLVGDRLSLIKLHEHTHLYSSDKKIDFPGRRFEVINYYEYNARRIKRLKFRKANISARNFPKSVAALRKELRIGDGGEDTLFFIRDYRDKLMMIHCKFL